MKKIIALVCLAVMLLTFTACGKFECESCGRESSGGHTIEVMGEKGKVCDDCYEVYKAFNSLGL